MSAALHPSGRQHPSGPQLPIQRPTSHRTPDHVAKIAALWAKPRPAKSPGRGLDQGAGPARRLNGSCRGTEMFTASFPADEARVVEPEGLLTARRRPSVRPA